MVCEAARADSFEGGRTSSKLATKGTGKDRAEKPSRVISGALWALNEQFW